MGIVGTGIFCAKTLNFFYKDLKAISLYDFTTNNFREMMSKIFISNF